MEKIKNFFWKMMLPVQNERGAQSLEWLGIAALVILVLGIISTAISNSESGITEIITSVIESISEMIG
ncbi:hypothetical protein [Alkalibacillus silvisoli]|uniref:Flagellin Flp1-like domain-containing protein n=1 Tax=Alkalibacillus silvisoli TaxID=392823 RepID=A0ABP3JVZ3_9BACI